MGSNPTVSATAPSFCSVWEGAFPLFCRLCGAFLSSPSWRGFPGRGNAARRSPKDFQADGHKPVRTQSASKGFLKGGVLCPRVCKTWRASICSLVRRCFPRKGMATGWSSLWMGYPMRFWRIPTTAIVAIVENLRWRNSLRSFPSLRSPSSVLCAPMIRWLSSMMIFWIFTIQKQTSGFSPSEPQIMMTDTPTLTWSITLSIFPATNAKRFPRPSSVPFYRRRVSYVEVLMGARRAP